MTVDAGTGLLSQVIERGLQGRLMRKCELARTRSQTVPVCERVRQVPDVLVFEALLADVVLAGVVLADAAAVLALLARRRDGATATAASASVSRWKARVNSLRAIAVVVIFLPRRRAIAA